MKILIDIGHPAHVHYFKNLIFDLRLKSDIFVTCRDTGIVQQLLSGFNIPYATIGTKQTGLYAKARHQLIQVKRTREIIIKQHIDIAMGVSATLAHAAKLTRAKSVIFDDDDQAAQPLMAKYVTPFADTVVSPDVLKFEHLCQAVYYPGYQELAYLHPNRFQPDPSIPAKYGVASDETYFVLRFNAFNAHHDVGKSGMSRSQKRRLIDLLSEHGRVFITTEAGLDPEYEKHKLPIAPHEIHDFLAYARMLVSDSQTMSTEAAIMGVPSFRCNSFAGKLAVLEEEEKRYGLTYAFLPHQFDWMLDRIKGFLQKDTKHLWQEKREAMLRDKIDVTAFWVWFVENYPHSREQVFSGRFDYERFK